MPLIEPGYMPDTYYADRYWTADYWAEYGIPTIVIRGSPSFSDPLKSDIGYSDPLKSDIGYR